ncbi:polyketide synthase [Candidatus Uabimicrobium amorphum]|uniref:Polyketide synthase n=2 Tax=Uabimicrobium amorphum TaxID=2596890 RepID=A0A5S9ISJ0_UABAM|nr:polyketide synthase [Candidatus Uabimicrobium amorphum]
MQGELKRVKNAQREPIAIVGLSCRLPGGNNSPQQLWNSLTNNQDAISEVPKDRWDIEEYFDEDPDAPGKMYTRYGGFMSDISGFDAEFFGIAPREAMHMDPQQRILLQVAWEALESAYCDMNALNNSNTGVFIGISSNEYAQTCLHPEEPERINAYLGTGNALSAAAGRLSYTFGLQGPSVSVDTACSSSLVSLHLACQSLRNGECSMAIAGGVNVMLSPMTTVTFSKARMMAADGRCKTFDARANGYVRGEGCGVIILKKYSDALADNDNILAVIKGSAINQDGRSGGFTAPNGLSQEKVIKKALRAAKVKPHMVEYIEAHGTGTSLGDPIEVHALGSVLQKGRENPFLMGSIKTNIGHLEAAAGIAGVIKVVLALHNEMLPASLHFQKPNPYITWDQVPGKVVTQNTTWPRGKKERIAGVSSFGFTGTNAHVVIGEAPQKKDGEALRENARQLLCVSAKNAQALQNSIRQLHDACNDATRIDSLCYYYNTRKAHLNYRVAVSGETSAELQKNLQKYLDKKSTIAKHKDSVWLFTGQGSQYFAMGKELYAKNETFRRHFDHCLQILRDVLDKPLEEIVWNSDTGEINETKYTQPALFAIEYSLAKTLLDEGVKPKAVLGHSVGEYVAACIADVFSVEDGLKLIAKRAQLMQQLPQNGAMLVAFTDKDNVEKIVLGQEDKVAIAAYNGPKNIVISGEKQAVAAIEKQLQEQEIRVEMLTVSHAFHSPLMEPMLEEFAACFSGVELKLPKINLISNLTAKPAGQEILSADYWCRHIRNAVRFSESIEYLVGNKHKLFVELGPAPILCGMARRCVSSRDIEFLPTLRKGREELTQWLDALGKLYTFGLNLNYKTVYPHQNYPKVTLPTYPFHQQKYWVEDPVYHKKHVHYRSGGHPFLQQQIFTANGQIIFESLLSTKEFSYLKDHEVFGAVIFPGTGYLEIACSAAKQIFGDVAVDVKDFSIYEPLLLNNEGLTLQVVVTPQDEESATFEIVSSTTDEQIYKAWKTHATGKIASGESPQVEKLEVEGRDIPREEYYKALSDIGLDYGENFQTIRKLQTTENHVFAQITAQENDAYHLHPAALDGCLQTLAALLQERDEVFVPIAVQKLSVVADIVGEIHCQLTLTGNTQREIVSADVTLWDQEDNLIAVLQKVQFKRSKRGSLKAGDLKVLDALYTSDWAIYTPKVSENKEQYWLIFGDNNLALPNKITVLFGEERKCEDGRYFIRRGEKEDIEWLWQQLEAQALNVVYCTSKFIHTTGDHTAWAQHLEKQVFDLLHIVQTAQQNKKVQRLFTVTQSAQQVEINDNINVLDAPLWGMIKTMAVELPEMHSTCIDIANSNDDLLSNVLQDDSEEQQFAIRDDKVYVARLNKYDKLYRDYLTIPQSEAYQLDIRNKGVIENLELIPQQRCEPQSGEVEVEVRASGLNFRDVMNALGLYPGDAGAMGSEFSGTVVRVHADVKDVKVGDEVFGIAAGSFNRYVVAQRPLIAHKPDNVNFAAAATIPVTFLTAYYGLKNLANAQSGQKILIHSAAGGVGQAAMRLAKSFGLEIFATAGSDRKRDLLRQQGAKYVFNSRTLDFAEEIHQAGHKMDIVLNSLAGEYIPKSMDLLKSQGYFVEIGKVEVWDEAQVKAHRNDVTYTAFDLAEVCREEPQTVQAMFRDILQLFAQEKIDELGYREFSLREAKMAFRYMAQAQHIGKVVLTQNPQWNISTEGTYVISGGFGGLGMKAAEWLISKGAQNIALLGASAIDDKRRESVSFLTAKASVSLHQVDVKDVSSLRDEMQKLPKPIKGVIHAAGVIRDGLILQQTPQNFRDVMDVKIHGAWNLWSTTHNEPLDFFVMYSSIAAVMGSPGQANYAAANAFLDAFAHKLSSAKNSLALYMPATSINWGPWAEVGMAARTAEKRKGSFGIEDLKPDTAMAIFENLITQPCPQVVAMSVSWPQIVKAQKRVSPFLQNVTRGIVQKKQARSSQLTTQLEKIPVSERRNYLLQFVSEQVSNIMGVDPESLQLQQPLQELGLDSLMAVELKNAVEQELDQELPTTLLFDYPNIEAITDYLVEDVFAWSEQQDVKVEIPVTKPSTDNEKIAVVGLSCRFPGAKDSESFWKMLVEGVDAISEVPQSRWDLEEYYDPDPDAPGKMYTKHGGFVDNVELFDAAFFGIAPREAESMDPQQRLFLEVSWEALENAGEMKAQLRNSRTGVFVGVSTRDYADLFTRSNDPSKIHAYLGTGNAFSAISGRLSYLLGLQGPSMSVDTACSSSLVATHLACQSLRSGESNLAVVGGVNLILSPSTTINFCKARMMADDGRCKTFDSKANGYVRGEGCGVVILKRLSDAMADNNNVLAVIHGSAVNQDGPSGGLTAPNGPSQEKVIREALHMANVAAKDIQYIEAHGTGTSLGDPIEMQALGKVLAKDREQPFCVGSLKTNIGHLEAAAGIAGLIKTVLSIHHRKIPAHLHFHEPSPYIPWKEIPGEVVTELRDWPQPQNRLAGISSFGFTGTNSHVILGDGVSQSSTQQQKTSPLLFTLSAHNETGLQALAARWHDSIANNDFSLRDICYTANTTRMTFAHRLACWVTSKEELQNYLAQYSAGERNRTLSYEKTTKNIDKVAWLFTGQGSQYSGMGKDLYEKNRAFQQAIDECEVIFQRETSESLRDIVFSDNTAIHETKYTQPALFAIEYALAKVWLSTGVTPQAVMGHSIGEFAAVCVAGVMSLEDTLKLVIARGRLMSALPKNGTMAVIFSDATTVAAQVENYENVAIAAKNGPQNTVISGEKEAIDALCTHFTEQKVRVEPLTVSHAFHSPLMQPMIAKFKEIAKKITYQAPQLAVVANVTANFADENTYNADYWCEHILQAVCFHESITRLHKQGYSTYAEIGPAPVLLGMARRCFPAKAKVNLLPSLRKGKDEHAQLLKSVADIYTKGYAIDWKKIYEEKGHICPLPTYAFQRKRYWLDLQPAAGSSVGGINHPFLQQQFYSVSGQQLFEGEISLGKQKFLAGHKVFSREVFPAAGFVELLMKVGKLVYNEEPFCIDDLIVGEPLVLRDKHIVQIALNANANGYDFEVFSRTDEDWQQHAFGKITQDRDASVKVQEWSDGEVLTSDVYYEELNKLGLQYSDAFQGIKTLEVRDERVRGHIALQKSHTYEVHPALLDSCLQTIAASLYKGDSNHNVYVPVRFKKITLYRNAVQECQVQMQLKSQSPTMVSAQFVLYDSEGVIAQIDSVEFHRVSRESLQRESYQHMLYKSVWRKEIVADTQQVAGDWLLFAPGENDVTQQLVDKVRCVAYVGEKSEKRNEILYVADNEQQIAQLWEQLPEEIENVVYVGNNNGTIRPLVHLLQTKKRKLQKVCVVTTDSVKVIAGDQVNGVHDATLWGMMKTLAVEQRDVDYCCIDIDATCDAELWWKILTQKKSELRWAMRGEDSYIERLEKYHSGHGQQLTLPVAENYHLTMDAQGVIDHLQVREKQRSSLGEHEVEIEVKAAGLNFRDVMNVLGLYPGDAGKLGGECAGIVTNIGSAVKNFAIGERVCGIASGCFSKYVVAHELLICKIPQHIEFAAAATIPITFLTAHYAFDRVAKLQRGEKVLIHAAAGGVGLAAIQLAKNIGAEIFATAGSDEKRDVLREWQVSHIMNSRSLDFAQQISDEQHNIDVVLNSLAGEYIPKSMSLLSNNGRFVEIGKVEIWDNDKVNALRSDVSYTAFDLAEMCSDTPHLVQEMLQELMVLFAAKKLQPLRHTNFSIQNAKNAFRYMAQAKHIGKVVITQQQSAWNISTEGSYVISGGLGGLGLKTAQWLESEGATSIVLLSRSAPNEQQQAILNNFSANIKHMSCDLSDSEQVKTVCAQITPPITGIFHSAGVLDDALFPQLTAPRFSKVFAPKIQGAWNLHQATASYDLSCFVMYSSITSLLGSPAQSNYTAANAFLDSLAHYRVSRGLKATVINWGPWSEVGMATRSDARQRRAFGIKDVSPVAGMNIMHSLLAQDASQAAVVDIDWRKYIKQFPQQIPQYLESVTRGLQQKRVEGATSEFAKSLENIPLSERRSHVVEFLSGEVAKVLGLDANEVEREQALQEMGLDSLMAVELKNAVETAIGSELPTTLLFDYPNIEAMADYLVTDIFAWQEEQQVVVARQSVENEPIAIIGLSCRFPGANNIEEFWQLLVEGKDAISEVPESRWDLEEYYDPDPDAPGKMYTKFGGFISDAAQFDAEFFGIAPREASSMDPQQRLILEVSWEALENAGETNLQDSRTGVFMGISTRDYAELFTQHSDPTKIHAYLGTGNAFSAASGRLSYILGLQGPSMSVDTACSSSLVATHLACQSLRSGESNLAIVGGVNLMLSPATTINFSKARMMSADGRCKTFDDSANGYVRGEGCGVVVLKRLSQAISDGNKIYALIKGSAVNQDGHSGGLTAPNGPAQEKVIREALHEAQVAAKDVCYIEAHGTGTSLGDPIELQALGKVLSEERQEPFVVGSLKTNIGHLEAAAGVAGLIKTALALHHSKIPAHLHFTKPSSFIPWKNIPVEVATNMRDWPQQRKKIAGVSSFGFTGTNSHVILEEAPQFVPQTTEKSLDILTISARNAKALQENAYRWLNYIQCSEDDLSDICYTANVGREHQNHRLCVTAKDHSSLCENLQLFLETGKARNVWSGNSNKSIDKLAWLFTGQGSQAQKMGAELYKQEPIFREAWDECVSYLDKELPVSLHQVVFGEDDPHLIHNTQYTQPALFAIEYALAKLWLSWGVTPQAVTGHSIGEFAAACIAGVFSVAEAAKLVTARGKLMAALPQNGKMAVIFTSAEQVTADLDHPQVAIAAINGPKLTVISGDGDGVTALCEKYTKQDVRVEMLTVSHAFHSPLMKPMIDDFRKVAETIHYQTPQIAFVSNLTGEFVHEFSADYWCKHILEAVRFYDGMRFLQKQKYQNFIEIGPAPVLLGMGRRCLPKSKGLWLPSLRNNQPQQMLKSFAQLYTNNYNPQWQQIYRGGNIVHAPTYAFQRKRYWLDVSASRHVVTSSQGLHPLLGERLQSPLISGHVFNCQVSLSGQHKFFRDHKVYEMIILPASAYLETVIAAAHEVVSEDAWRLSGISLQEPLVFEKGKDYGLQTVLQSNEKGFDVKIYSQDGDWKEHLRANIEHVTQPIPAQELPHLQKTRSVDMTDSYQQLTQLGLDYGPMFRGVTQIDACENGFVGEVHLPSDQSHDYYLHPALLDACFHVFAAGIAEEDRHNVYIPLSIDAITFYERATKKVISHVVPQPSSSNDMFAANIGIYSEEGRCIALLEGFRVRRVSRAVVHGVWERQFYDWWFVHTWQKRPGESSKAEITAHDWFVIGNEEPMAQKLTALLQETQAKVSAVTNVTELEKNEVWKQSQLRKIVFVAPQCKLEEQNIFVLQLLQQMRKDKGKCQLNIVTQNSVRVEDENNSIFSMSLNGFAKVISLEHPEWKCATIDVDPQEVNHLQNIVDECLREEHEQVAYRDDERYVARVVPYETYIKQQNLLHIPDSAYRLDMSKKGQLKNLTYVAGERYAPEQGQVEIEVIATGLNFRDVMNALDLYPGDAGHLGGECSGRIVAIGEGVNEFSVGDKVMAIAPASFGKYVTTAAYLAVKKPQNVSFSAGATIPITFLTVYYGLWKLANLQAGERILIHSAAGGVGLAAIQFAQHVGAEIFATAGSERKRQFLRDLGVKHVMDSRSLDFAAQIKASTGERKIDVVLNSLAGDYIRRSMELLAPQGRFVEIGKMEILDDAQVKAVYDDIHYYNFDLAEMATNDPQIMREMYTRLEQDFTKKYFRGLPHKVFSKEKTVHAFRYMARAKHIGKIVVSGRSEREFALQSDATYIVTGGLGGLGQLLMKWLVDNGAKNIALFSRRSPGEEQQQDIARCGEESGAHITCFAVDVCDQDSLRDTIAKINDTLPQIRGVIHAAGVIDDGFINQQDEERFYKVLRPKMRGAWYLHELTQNYDLDFFVLFSSIASFMGSPGQANYAAGNAFLDGLAHYRHSRGLPATSINWGPWGEAGMAAAAEKSGKGIWQKRGIESLKSQQGLKILELLISKGHAQIGVIANNKQKFMEQLAAHQQMRWMDALVAQAKKQFATKTVAAPKAEILDKLRKVNSNKERHEMLVNYIRDEIAKVLELESGEDVAPDMGFFDLGMDSLTAMEFKNILENNLGYTLATSLVFDYPTIESLTSYLIADIFGETEDNVATETAVETTMTTPITVEEEQQDFDDLSEEELMDLLENELREIREGNNDDRA